MVHKAEAVLVVRHSGRYPCLAMNDIDVLAELREQTRWLRLMGLQALRPLLVDALQTDKERLAFEVSDGTRSTREVGGIAGMSSSKVSGLWREWIAAGICAESSKHPGRAERLVSLARIGIEVPAWGAAAAAKGGVGGEGGDE
jgi:hypothetical protein